MEGCHKYCGGIPSVLWWDIISTVEGCHQYYGGITSVLWRDTISAVRDTISNLEDIQYGEGKPRCYSPTVLMVSLNESVFSLNFVFVSHG